MEIQLQSIHFDADKKLIEFAEKKVAKLSNYHDKIVDARIYLKFDSSNSAIKEKTAEVKVNIPGATLFASETSKSFEAALDHAVDSLKKQLKKSKDKFKK